VWVAFAVITATVLFHMFLGLYTLPPADAPPGGRTAIVWRAGGEPFFNSPDALCPRRGDASACRALALSRAPTRRTLLRMPYYDWAYRQSTRGVR